VDKDAIADPGVWQPIWLIEPAPNCTRVTACVSGERLEIDEIV
jgi:hypothetical protein